jgi:hypothetical protein
MMASREEDAPAARALTAAEVYQELVKMHVASSPSYEEVGRFVHEHAGRILAALRGAPE